MALLKKSFCLALLGVDMGGTNCSGVCENGLTVVEVLTIANGVLELVKWMAGGVGVGEALCAGGRVGGVKGLVMAFDLSNTGFVDC